MHWHVQISRQSCLHMASGFGSSQQASDNGEHFNPSPVTQMRKPSQETPRLNLTHQMQLHLQHPVPITTIFLGMTAPYCAHLG